MAVFEACLCLSFPCFSIFRFSLRVSLCFISIDRKNVVTHLCVTEQHISIFFTIFMVYFSDIFQINRILKFLDFN